ncbi:MAG: acetyl-CoA decarbonylase/synthase complex subunit gamma [Candidatus Helarchaeota archaeon]|nr:acetyl-CoA decarbonylase/synthase complex subunit gamma [Candidatus Helarchaeota archaeon]
MPKVSPIQVIKYLPSTNCGECGEETCMAFTVKLLDHEVKIEDCKPIIRETKYAKKLENLKELVTPPIRLITIGVGDNAVEVGGEEVLYRHELTYYNRTPIFIDVADDNEAELIRKVKYVKDFTVYRLGQNFYLQGIALRSRSNDPATFSNAVKKCLAAADLPLILCSLNSAVLNAGLKAAKGKNPLIYAATKDNWEEVGKLALEHNCGIVVFSEDLNELKSIAKSLKAAGIEKIALDPGTCAGEGLAADTLNKQLMLKKAAIHKGDKDVGWPTVGVTATVWIGKKKDMSEGERIELAYEEGKLASMLVSNACNLLIQHTEDVWFQLAMLVVKDNIYADPRINPAVDAKLYVIGSPGPKDPVFMTSNYTMTYFTVESDLKDMKINAWLLVVDTEGISVESSVAGGQMNAGKVTEAIKETGLEDKVEHRIIIIPGLAARISGELESLSNWKVLVGPRDSSGIPDLMKKYWDLDKLMKKWKDMQE